MSSNLGICWPRVWFLLSCGWRRVSFYPGSGVPVMETLSVHLYENVFIWPPLWEAFSWLWNSRSPFKGGIPLSSGLSASAETPAGIFVSAFVSRVPLSSPGALPTSLRRDAQRWTTVWPTELSFVFILLSFAEFLGLIDWCFNHI